MKGPEKTAGICYQRELADIQFIHGSELSMLIPTEGPLHLSQPPEPEPALT